MRREQYILLSFFSPKRYLTSIVLGRKKKRRKHFLWIAAHNHRNCGQCGQNHCSLIFLIPYFYSYELAYELVWSSLPLRHLLFIYDPQQSRQYAEYIHTVLPESRSLCALSCADFFFSLKENIIIPSNQVFWCCFIKTVCRKNSSWSDFFNKELIIFTLLK